MREKPPEITPPVQGSAQSDGLQDDLGQKPKELYAEHRRLAEELRIAREKRISAETLKEDIPAEQYEQFVARAKAAEESYLGNIDISKQHYEGNEAKYKDSAELEVAAEAEAHDP